MNWKDLKENWLNGNLSDTKDRLYQSSKLKIFKIMDEAIAAHLDDDCAISEDLKILMEIVRSLANPK